MQLLPTLNPYTETITWYDAATDLPPAPKGNTDLPITVLVKDGLGQIGYGIHWPCKQEWHYNIPSLIEQDDNNIAFWAFMPKGPERRKPVKPEFPADRIG